MICSCTVLLPTTVSMSFCHNDISVMCVPYCGQGLEVYVSVDVSFVVDKVLRGHNILQSLICKAVLTESHVSVVVCLFSSTQCRSAVLHHMLVSAILLSDNRTKSHQILPLVVINMEMGRL